MNWGGDPLGSKKSAPKEGRRMSSTLTQGDSEEILDDSLASNGGIDISAPVRTRKMGVWSEEASKYSKGKNGSNIIELERFQNEKIQESDDDIPVIPDIDDLQDDPLNLPDVKPIISVDKSTYKELDNNFGNLQSEQVNFGNLGDIDLSFLTSKLYPEKDVQPCTEVWTMESLFNDLSRSAV
ncbi:intraflagellar transport protein 43 homolog [Anoplophora glabripennis]|uniref:intraflagellar transport protein 43 homolog n=1 Tax=Anoplophora glabripennis TaxID=217634 RepID=UPI000873ABFB|nr:intraflagellar transport protein 43 homolog [Anoplophora glabripennis]